MCGGLWATTRDHWQYSLAIGKSRQNSGDHVKKHYSAYAWYRAKWNIAKGFRYELKSEDDDSFYLALKAGGARKVWQNKEIRVKKVVNSRGVLVGGICQNSEMRNSGFPDPALCLLNYKGKLPFLEINKRWLKPESKETVKAQGPTVSEVWREQHGTSSFDGKGATHPGSR